MLIVKPYLDLNISIDNAAAGVYVNGALVIKDRTGQPSKLDYPLNHLLRSGDNEIELRLFDFEDEPAAESCEALLTLRLRTSGEPAEAAQTVATLGYSAKAGSNGSPTDGSSPEGRFDSLRGFGAYQSGDVLVGPVTVEKLPPPWDHITSVKRTVNLPLPLQPWVFLSGQRMKQAHEQTEQEAEPLYRELLAAYVEIWHAFAAKNTKRLLQMFAERNRELDAAFWRQSGETEKLLIEHLESTFADPELKLAEIELPNNHHWALQMGTQGTLAGLTFPERAEAILRFENQAGDLLTMNFPVWFRRDKGRFIATR